MNDNGAAEEKKSKKWEWGSWKQWVIALCATAGVVLIDQVSKAIIRANLDPYQWITLIDPVLKVTHAHNYQGIFSISLGPSFIYIVLPILAMIFVLYLLLQSQTKFVAVLLGMVLGGGLGNLIDRLAHGGYVVDWISMGVRNWRWATYNLADASIVVAVILLLIKEFFFTKHGRKEEEQA